MEMGKRTLTMDYELLDSPAVNELRTRIRTDRYWGAGFYSILHDANYFMQLCLSFVIADFVLGPLLTDSRALQTPCTCLLALCFAANLIVSGVYLTACLSQNLSCVFTYTHSLGYDDYFLYRSLSPSHAKVFLTDPAAS